MRFLSAARLIARAAQSCQYRGIGSEPRPSQTRGQDMAERKATNKYYPPEWTPDQGSLNTFRGSHPLRERARKLDQGILIIRFELPYNIWCNGCGSHVGMGVRYNAQKTKVGNYYSTSIYKFRMKCHLCDSHFEIQTDPKNMDYVIVSGASRKNERWQEKEGETVSVEGHSEAQKLASDPMYRLEHGVQDKSKADEAAPRIATIIAMNEEKLEDFSINQLIRKKFREEKAVLKAKAEADADLQKRASISIPLVDEQKDDVRRAQTVQFATGSSLEARKRKRREIKSQSLFGDVDSPSSKISRQTALKTGVRLDGSIFGKGKERKMATETGKASVKLHRESLGIRPTFSTSSVSEHGF